MVVSLQDTVVGLLLMTGCVQAFAQVVAQISGPTGIYTCVDASGRRLTADRPIKECVDRAQRELGPSGTVRRTIGPSLTAEERAIEEDKARKAAEERSRANEERRRERALLARYPDRAAHDKERQSALSQVDLVIRSADVRTTELVSERKRLEGETEFYRKDPAAYPLVLKRQLEENENNQAAQKRFIANQNEEKKRIHLRFDDELDQLRRLWGPQGRTAGTK